MPAVPSWPKGKPFADAPRIEDLHRRTGIPIAKLRELLKDVPRGKCSDNTVRYDPDAAEAAIGETNPVADEVSDAAAAAVAEPLPLDPTQAALAVMNRTLALFSLVVRERGEIVKVATDVIRAMGEPLKLGQELVRENQQLMRDRLKLSDDQWLTLVELVEAYHGAKDERDRMAVREADRSALRRETMGMLKQYGPVALEKFSLTAEASLAVEVMRAIDPDLIDFFADQLPEELRPKVAKMAGFLRQRRAAAERAKAAKGAGDGRAEEPEAGPEPTTTTTGETVTS